MSLKILKSCCGSSWCCRGSEMYKLRFPHPLLISVFSPQEMVMTRRRVLPRVRKRKKGKKRKGGKRQKGGLTVSPRRMGSHNWNYWNTGDFLRGRRPRNQVGGFFPLLALIPAAIAASKAAATAAALGAVGAGAGYGAKKLIKHLDK